MFQVSAILLRKIGSDFANFDASITKWYDRVLVSRTCSKTVKIGYRRGFLVKCSFHRKSLRCLSCGVFKIEIVE